jgi:antitoxin (DNA-binding transcriptional repressor) of toxin-antitoxin stability system
VRAVGLKVLKNKLSEYVRLAQRGETILVTDRERVVAELVPPRDGRSPAVADAVLAELVRQGWLTPAAHPLTAPPSRVPVASFNELMRELGTTVPIGDLPRRVGGSGSALRGGSHPAANVVLRAAHREPTGPIRGVEPR